jgi:hypothetical protein
MVLESEVFGRWLGHECGAFINGIRALRRDPKNSLALFLPGEELMRNHQSTT